MTGALDAEAGPFVLLRFLGEGGGGIVHEARRRDAPAEPSFALKILHDELALSPKERKRFLDEAKRMRRVEHEGLMALFDAGELPDGRPYLAMPCLQGESLASRVARGPLPADEAVRHFGMLARAVQAVHDAGMIHRDIKPENIFLDGSPPRAILLDFGIARDISAERSTTTALGRVRGTPAYMAPERFFGTSANVATDVYELGVVFYVMLTGDLPWGADATATDRLHPAPPVGVAPGLAATVQRALSMRPEMRPPDAETFAREVEARYAEPGAELAPRETGDAIAYPAPRETANAVGYAPTIRSTPPSAITQPLAVAAPAPPPAPAARSWRIPVVALLVVASGVSVTAAVRRNMRHVASAPPVAESAATASAAPPPPVVVSVAPVDTPAPVPSASFAAHSSAPRRSKPAAPRASVVPPVEPSPPPAPAPPSPPPRADGKAPDKLLEDRR